MEIRGAKTEEEETNIFEQASWLRRGRSSRGYILQRMPKTANGQDYSTFVSSLFEQ